MATVPTPKPRRRPSEQAKRTIRRLNERLDALHERHILILGALLGLAVTLVLVFLMVCKKIEVESTSLKQAVEMKIEGEIFALMHLKRDFNERIESKILEIDGKVDEWLHGGGGRDNDSDESTCVSKVDESGGKVARRWFRWGFFRVPKKDDVVKGFVSKKDNVVKGFVATKEDVVKGFVSKKENVVKGFVSTKEGVVGWFKGWRSGGVEKKSDESLDEIKGLPTPTPIEVADVEAVVDGLGQEGMSPEKGN